MVKSIIFIVITSTLRELNYTFFSCQSYIFLSRTINIIIITNIIEIMTIKMMFLTIIILLCDYSHKY